tara:strand:- start:897 stop:1595 length:699 start_codon:yes stop_codon:yes gene_type:complete
MPIVLPNSFASREEPQSTDDYLWLVEATLKKSVNTGSGITPAVMLRMCQDTSVITWPVSDPDNRTWSPFNFAISTIESNGEGDLPSLQLTVENVGRVLMPTLHSGQALEGNPVSIYLVPRSGIAIAHPNHEYQQWDFEISTIQADSETVSLRLERVNFFSKVVPQDRFTARRCRWKFGSENCGYVINSNAAFTECPKTLAACIARGEDHKTRGLPCLHPRRFGGFPGIPKQQ